MLLDSILKYLPLLVFVVPLLAWLDKAKRFAHRRKYYIDRLEAVKTYLTETKRTDISEFEKECAAQALACSEKLGFKEVEYVIKNHPSRFFALIGKLYWARNFLELKDVNGVVKMTSPSRKQRLIKIRWAIAGVYLLSIAIIELNKIAVFLIKLTGVFQPFVVGVGVFLFGQIICMIAGIFFAIISAVIYLEVDAAIEVYDELNVVKVESTYTGFRFFPEP